MDNHNPFYHRLQTSGNVLLVKDDVGKPKKTVRDLPHEGHFYGSSLKKDAEGAADIIYSWNEHKPTETSPVGKDFKKLNKLTLNQRLSAKQVNELARNSAAFVREKVPKKGGRSASGEAFGMANKPGTPITEVVSHNYGNSAEIEKIRAYEEGNKKKQFVPRNILKVGRKEESEEKKLFKMKKFQLIGSKICSGI